MFPNFPQSQQTKILTILQRYYPELQGVYIFGSTVSGEAHNESDLDLAILLPTVANSDRLWECKQELETVLMQDVDLIDLQKASTVLRAQIINTGFQILELDRKACQSFEMLSLSMYLRFNEERVGIVEAILQDKRIFE
jgi:uncharacterized protein